MGWGGVGQRGAQVASQGYLLPLPLCGDECTSASQAARPVTNASSWICVIRKNKLVFLIFLYLGQQCPGLQLGPQGGPEERGARVDLSAVRATQPARQPPW